MKITADGILGSAQKINNKRKVDEGNSKDNRKDIKTDSLALGKAINSRIESIEREIKDIQTSLTKNQIIREGIDNILKNSSPENINQALEVSSFEGRKILKEFLGNDMTPSALETKKSEITKLINNDINNLTKVQVEVDNIIASNLTGNRKVENLMSNMNDIFRNTPSNLETISKLDADKVMKLVR
ncbi:MAG TPA: hypothetical protein PK358_02330 [Spirochaetota bacterium]|nr:hypothetical protein [Spirochaetota bacterium]HPJ33643.1 hypothetical protein [Spirochaetota bacterium]